MRVTNPAGMCLSQSVPTVARRRRWKRKTMLVLTDVSGAKQLSVLTRRCCLLAPCRRRMKRPRLRHNTINAVEWESAKEKCEDDENLQSNTGELHKEENKTEPPSQNLEEKVNISLKKSRTLIEQANGTEEKEEGIEQQCLNAGLFTINGGLNGEPFEDLVDNGTASSEVNARFCFTAINTGNEQSIVLMSPSQVLKSFVLLLAPSAPRPSCGVELSDF